MSNSYFPCSGLLCHYFARSSGSSMARYLSPGPQAGGMVLSMFNAVFSLVSINDPYFRHWKPLKIWFCWIPLGRTRSMNHWKFWKMPSNRKSVFYISLYIVSLIYLFQVLSLTFLLCFLCSLSSSNTRRNPRHYSNSMRWGAATPGCNSFVRNDSTTISNVWSAISFAPRTPVWIFGSQPSPLVARYILLVG